jgi:glycolate dehydrogenase FAD-binding subunit
MSAATPILSVREALTGIVGAEFVRAGGEGGPLVVSPANAQEAAAVMRWAAASGTGVRPCGGQTRLHLGNVAGAGTVLVSTQRMEEVVHYDAGDLTIGVGAGFKLSQLLTMLADHGQMLPIDIACDDETVGGMLATAWQGPSRQMLAVRDFCIGIEFVTGDGKVAHGGGRVVKNVAGYDLMKLLIGSYGTLGMITAASFKVFPRAKQTATYILEFEAWDACARRARELVKSGLAAMRCEIVSPRALEYFGEHAEPRNADDYVPAHPVHLESRWLLALEAGGSDAVLARVARELGPGAKRLHAERESDFWQDVARVERRALARHRNIMSAQVTFPPAELAGALAAVESAALDNNLLPAVCARASAAVLDATFVPLSVDPPSAMQYASAVSALRAELPPGSTVVVMRCPVESKDYFSVWGSSPTDGASQKAIKQALDPKGILMKGEGWV